jgi:hypothetical protein
VNAVDPVLYLPDAQSLADLASFVARGKRADPDGAARLVGHGDVLAVYVSPLHVIGAPTVLGLRTTELARPTRLDVTVPLAALSDRFARLGVLAGDACAASGTLELAVPPASAVVAWAGVAPPRRGWEPLGLLTAAVLQASARRGVAEVASGTSPGAGASAVAQLRARVWGRPLADDVPDAPSGIAFAADALAFVRDDEPAALYRCGSWMRLTTSAGHVLSHRPAL